MILLKTADFKHFEHFPVLSKITVSQVCLKLFPCDFLLNSGESQVVVTSFTHIHSGVQ